MPSSAVKQIVSVLNLTAEGQRSDVISASPEWTIQEAAEFLDMPEGGPEVASYRKDAAGQFSLMSGHFLHVNPF